MAEISPEITGIIIGGVILVGGSVAIGYLRISRTRNIGKIYPTTIKDEEREYREYRNVYYQ